MVNIIIYVEGGGTTRKEQTPCREGFKEFFNKLNIQFSFKIIACGSRTNTYNDFCRKLKNMKPNEYCLLLVDSETSIHSASVWEHVRLNEKDKWQKPDKATDKHLHFMTECLESWFMADKQALADYYGKNFNQNALSKNTNIESISKQDLYNTLKNATKKTTKGSYSKGGHSFEILRKIDANKVVESSSYAKRLYDTLQNPFITA